MPRASVIIVSTYYPPVLGGAETAAAQLAEFLAARGHRVTVITKRTDAGVPRDEQRNGVHVIRVAPRGARAAPGKWLAVPAVTRELLKRRDHDVVVCIDYRGIGIAALLARASTGTPVIFQAATNGVLSFAAVNRTLDRVGLGAAAPVLIRPLRHIYNRADAYPCISHDIEAETLAAGVPADRILYLPNPVDARAFRPATGDERRALRADRRIPPHAVVAIIVGRLSREKGQLEALQAWAMARPERGRLLLLGPDMPGHPWDTGPAAREFVRREGLESSVVFAGGVDRDAVAEYLRLADFAIQPSHFEAFGTAALEAMAAGLPVIASDVGGLKDFVEPGSNGIRVPPRDPAALARAITAFVNDDTARAALSEGARHSALRFDIPLVLGQFADLIERVSARRRP